MERGAVIVTGASTGIGEATATHLAGLGFRVFAGVRKEADAERLRAGGSDRLTPVILDVTDEGSIAAAIAQVREATGEAGLAGLVNNAGIAVSGPIELVALDDLRRQLEVNVVGQVAMTQAALPLLRAARGRIVNIGSIGGRVALPVVGPYAASKFALEAITDALRREVGRFGIEVTIIEPGGIVTPIWAKSRPEADALAERLTEEQRELYGDLIAAVRRQAEKIPDRGLPPSAVAEAVADALTSRKPKTRQVVGRDAKMRVVMTTLLSDRGFDRLVGRALR